MDLNSLKKVFIIAEIGQNHQGDLETAKTMIKAAHGSGVDCVKFQKSNLKAKFTTSALSRPYLTENSWGPTYGEHKEFLEFSIDQFSELKEYAESLGLVFSASAMDIVSFDELKSLNLKFIKIGSGDTNNIPMMRYISTQNIPLIVSTGMQSEDTIKKVHNIFSSANCNFALLHCISAYPTKFEDTKLGFINKFKNLFNKTTIGYSGHEIGLEISLIAVLLGAKVIERHFTLDKNLKGSDHSASLTPFEFSQLVQTIRSLEDQHKLPIQDKSDICDVLQGLKLFNEDIKNIVEVATNEVGERQIYDCEWSCKTKLGKSLVYSNAFFKDQVLTAKDIKVKVSQPNGLSAEHFDEFIGKVLNKDVLEDCILKKTDFE